MHLPAGRDHAGVFLIWICSISSKPRATPARSDSTSLKTLRAGSRRSSAIRGSRGNVLAQGRSAIGGGLSRSERRNYRRDDARHVCLSQTRLFPALSCTIRESFPGFKEWCRNFFSPRSLNEFQWSDPKPRLDGSAVAAYAYFHRCIVERVDARTLISRDTEWSQELSTDCSPLVPDQQSA